MKPFDAEEFLARLVAVDAVLVDAGFPPIAPWWWETLIRFLRNRAGRRALRSLILRVGRRGGKSSTLTRLAVTWALYGPWSVPPGDVGVIAFLSVRQDESNQRLRTIESILQALGEPYRRTAEGLELIHRPCVFKTFPASTMAVVGFTCILEIDDEVAAWRDRETGANPATEVLALLAPTRATQPWSFRVVSSSPRSTLDRHFELFEAGDTDEQMVAYAPTWIANPTISEEQTRADETDQRIWSREYLAVPQAGTSAAFDVEAVDRAFRPRKSKRSWQRVLVLDPSSGRKDAWTWGVAGWDEDDYERRYIRFDVLDGLHGRFFGQVDGDEIVTRLVQQVCVPRSVRSVHADQREALMIKSAFERHRLSYRAHDWTAQSKPLAVEQVRRWLAQDQLVLPPHDKLRRELLSFEERITPTGHFSFAARGSGHDDYVSLLVTLAMAEIDRGLLGSPRHDDDDFHIISIDGGRYATGRGITVLGGRRPMDSAERWRQFFDDRGTGSGGWRRTS